MSLFRAGKQEPFERLMQKFEEAKKTKDFVSCEKFLVQALQYKVEEYAAGSLVWAQMNQNKTEAALVSAQQMLNSVGYTPYALGSYIDASLGEGIFTELPSLIQRIKQSDLMSGTDWKNVYLRDMVNKATSLIQPALYEIRWTIPSKTFAAGKLRYPFGFPLLKTPEQTFDYVIEGAAESRVIESSAERAIVEIEARTNKPVTVVGTLSIRATILGAKTTRRLARISLSPAPASKTGNFYYWTEAFDIATPEIQPVVRLVKRPSAVETVQAILDWRNREMPYKELPPGDGNTLQKIMRFQCGVCHHASYMTATLARANGIPAVVMGAYVLPETGAFNNIEGSHGFVSVELPEAGWTNIEPLDPKSLNAFGRSNYIRFCRQETREIQERISLQSFLVSGRRVR